MNELQDATVRSRQEAMIRQQVMERGISDERVISALRAVPRERFFPANAQEQAFADRAAAIGHGQTISQPYMVALMTARLNVRPGQRVLEVGTGSGYQTAILAQLAGEVWTVERVKPLLDESFERLMEMGIRNVHYRLGDGTLGWPDAAPFNRVLIGAGAPSVPTRLLNEQLAEGGVAVLPVGALADQLLIEVRKQDGVLRQIELCACRFVKLIGEEGWNEDRRGDFDFWLRTPVLSNAPEPDLSAPLIPTHPTLGDTSKPAFESNSDAGMLRASREDGQLGIFWRCRFAHGRSDHLSWTLKRLKNPEPGLLVC